MKLKERFALVEHEHFVCCINAFREDFLKRNIVFSCIENSYKISLQGKFLHCMQNMEISYQKLLPQFFYIKLLYLSKETLALCDLSTNSQNKEQNID